MTNLHILTLSWFGKEKLEKLYPTLVSSLTDINYKWYIKENGSNDGSIEMINSWNNSNVIGINYPHNRDSFSFGSNFLFKEASPENEDLILLLNNDIIFNDKLSLKKMVGLINKDNEIGVVGAKLLFPDNLLAHAGVVFPKFAKGLPTHYRSKEKDDKNSSKDREFQAVTGAVFLTKAKYYSEISYDQKSDMKGLDHALRWAFDDIDACFSIKHNMNKKIIYCGGTNISHEESITLKKNPVNRLFLNHNMAHFRMKWMNKVIIDQELYKKDPKYNLYEKK